MRKIIAILVLIFFNISVSAACYSHDHKKAKAELNRVYNKIYNSTYLKNSPKLNRQRRAALEKSQKAWVEYRNSYCDEYIKHAAGPSAKTGASEYGCNLNITLDRIKQLKQEMYY